MAAVVALVVGLGASLVEIPYLAISPGSAVEVGPLVEVTGGPNFAPEGEIYLVTVRLAQVTLVGALRGWLDPSVEVVARGRIVPPDLMVEELRDINLAQMEGSKRQALGVAFEELGYDAISGTGAQVVQVEAGSPAGGALVAGDTIVGLDQATVTTHHDVIETLSQRRPGARVDLLVDPPGAGEQRTVALTLAASVDDPGTPFLGATLGTRQPRFELPFDVDIASEHIGGPSAGLAFTLEVLDVLTEGELTGGQRVAATGTVELDGSVGVVGGVVQKTAAAVEEGVQLFLVPLEEAAEARRRAGDDVVVEGVDSLAGALRALADHGGEPLLPPP